jgi:hypothetical protein
VRFEILKHSPRRAHRSPITTHASGFLMNCPNKKADAATLRAASANVSGRGRRKPAIRDARASARSMKFRRPLEPTVRVGLRRAWREAGTPG